ncbi:MAG: GAF domain-containing protein, partial [Alphaproteobacteria bacterium]|nr:GAF domain-containing protein [Alphaproteobacteria bacterium]
TDPAFEPHRQVAREAGFRAVLSAPLVSGADKLIGILSTHFSQPRQFRGEETAAMTAYCASVALALERRLMVQNGTHREGPASADAAE